jgi:hypothetical protein
LVILRPETAGFYLSALEKLVGRRPFIAFPGNVGLEPLYLVLH